MARCKTCCARPTPHSWTFRCACAACASSAAPPPPPPPSPQPSSPSAPRTSPAVTASPCHGSHRADPLSLRLLQGLPRDHLVLRPCSPLARCRRHRLQSPRAARAPSRTPSPSPTPATTCCHRERGRDRARGQSWTVVGSGEQW